MRAPRAVPSRGRMMRLVLEDSVEGFVSRFRSVAVEVAVAGRVEGDPLLECIIDGRALHVFERTGPYLVRGTSARIILHVECDEVAAVDAAEDKHFEVVGVSALSVHGVVRQREDPFLVVDAGVPLVVGLTGPMPDLTVGGSVRFTSRAPVHGFVLPGASVRAAADHDDLV
jgi:hypothetical protein